MRQRELESEVATQTDARRPAQLAQHPVLSLQRRAGNRAVSQLLAPARDHVAEGEADKVAEQAGMALGPGEARQAVAALTGAGITRLPAELQAALRPHVGDTSSVTVDTGPEAGAAAEAIGARAFADGPRINLGPGERSAPDAAGLLLHEAAHGATHAPRREGGRHLVHAKLQGTRVAVEAQGGASSSGKGRKLLAKFSKKALTKWDQILHNLTAYEAAETAVLAHGPVSPHAMANATPRLLALLTKIETSLRAWLAGAGGEATHRQNVHENDEGEESDARTKVGRRQAVAMLQTRVGSERADLQTGRWSAGMGLTDAKRTGGKDAEDKGQMSSVDRVIYDIAGTSFEGFFKADKGFEGKAPGHQTDVGISKADPNYGGRSVAMHRLDQLLQTGVIAHSEFAVHNNTMGAVTAKAAGTQASKAKLAITDLERNRTGGDTISAEDPVLQRGLNKLQVIDAIAGQLDRHAGNYFIQTDGAGKVTGITGIDLDMAFGKDMADPSMAAKPGSAAHYRGVPALVDYQLGQRLLQITEADIEAAITGLLSPQEVAATTARFRIVRAHAQALSDSGSLTQAWNAQTASQGRAAKPSAFSFEFSDISTYVNALTDDAAGASSLATPVSKGLVNFLDDWRTKQGEMPSETVDAIYNGCTASMKKPIIEAAYRGDIGVDQAPMMAVALAMSMLGDDRFLGQLEIASQEQNDVGALIAARVSQSLPGLIAQGPLVGVG